MEYNDGNIDPSIISGIDGIALGSNVFAASQVTTQQFDE